ncbi:MAG: hypothetical protein ABI665_13035 [Vicinamibacterales bacterium]
MKRLFLFALMLGVAACGGDKGSPTAPSSLMQTEGSSTSITSGATAALTPTSLDGEAVPFHILHPVLFPMNQGLVVFPPRNEPNVFFQNLQTLYRDTLRRPQDAPTYVDSEGQNVWLTEYFRFYLNGCSHEEASSRTLTEIATGSTLPTCGSENLAFPPRNLPNDFQNRLQAAYRDVLRRPQTLSYVDSEGANVWLAQYLRFRVSGGCDHATAESKVFTEIRGGGVQADCGPPWTRSGTGNTVFDMPRTFSRVRIQGVWGRRDNSNFIVFIGGRLTVNEILRTSITYDGIHLTSGGVVEIVSSGAISWTFTEVR